MSWKRVLIVVLAALHIVGLLVVGAAYYRGFRQAAGWPGSEGVTKEPAQDQAKTVKAAQAAQKKMSALLPRGLYIVIDTAENRLYLKKGESVVRTAVISCGSGVVLEESGGKQRTWVFDTPRGEFAVKSKITNPYWVKPDWAFIEEGEPIPNKTEERIEAGTLGDYALGFGEGYFIHGTLYTRLLGRNVTHGCVRVGDEDLKAVFQVIPLGAKIYIY